MLLAPMAGVSDVAMRQLCLEAGVQLTYTEMVSAKALSFANEKTRHLLDLAAGERRKSGVAVQIFGHEPDVMARQAAWVEDALGENLALIDINMGCPARKIAGRGDGSALMRNPDLAARIVSDVSRAVNHPVTVKFRRGFFEGEEIAPEFARRMEAAGAAAVCVHGRYAQQMYNGSSDWGCIARVACAVSIPVIGNGDISSGADALQMFRETGCDSVMIGRAARGNPWVFSDVRAAIEREFGAAAAGGAQGASSFPRFTPPTPEERIEMARRHAQLLSQREGRNIVRMRKHAAWYVQGMPGARAARAKFNACETLQDFNHVFDEMKEYASERAQQTDKQTSTMQTNVRA